MKNIFFAVLMFSIFSITSFGQGGPLTSINGVMCGVSADPTHKAVPTGTYTYLFNLNTIEIKNESVNLDLQLEYLYCTKLNNQFIWIRLQRLPGLYAYTQRLHKSGEKWKAKGFWDTATINDTSKSGVFNVRFDNMKIKKLLTKDEYTRWQAGKTTEIYLKLDLSSEKYSYFIGGYMALKLTLLPDSTIEALSMR